MTQLEILQAARLGYIGKLAELDQLIAAETGEPTPAIEESAPLSKRRKMSAATRAKMAEGQRKRWAKLNGELPEPVAAITKAPRKKRRLSVAGRKAIADATRKRWAAFHAAKRNAA